MLLCLTVFGNLNLQANTCPTSPLEIVDECPTAKFSVVNNDSQVGTPIQFSNQSTGATSYLWDFGDGGSSTALNPTHTYSAAGIYTVKLYATGGGCTVEFIGTEDIIQI